MQVLRAGAVIARAIRVPAFRQVAAVRSFKTTAVSRGVVDFKKDGI